MSLRRLGVINFVLLYSLISFRSDSLGETIVKQHCKHNTEDRNWDLWHLLDMLKLPV